MFLAHCQAKNGELGLVLSYPYACADPESFVRGGPFFTFFFFFFFSLMRRERI